MDSKKFELDELKYEYNKLVRLRDNLQKNLDRRKKLNLVDEDYADDIKSEISGINDQIDIMHQRVRKLESEAARAKIISETKQRAPWEK